MSILHRIEIHKFEEFGKTFLLDVCRNSVYIIDELTSKLLDFCHQPREETDIVRRMTQHYSTELALKSLEFLKRNEILVDNVEPIEITYLPFTNKFSIALNVAQSCNLRCRYCYVEKAPTGTDHSLMDEATAKKAIDFIFSFDEMGNLGVAFYGGEPLLNYPVIKSSMLYAIQKAKERGFSDIGFHITTNGTLINDEIIDFFKDYDMDVLISLDGAQEVHDANRIFPNGEGSHRIVIDNLEKLIAKSGNHHASASAVITRGHRLTEAYNYLSLFALRDMKISYVRYQKEKEFSLTEEEKDQYISDMREIARDCLDRLLKGKRPPYYNFETRILQLWRGAKKKHFCPAGIRRFGISPDGGIYPCGVAAAQGMHKIGDLDNGIYLDEKTRLLKRISVENREGCVDCWARYLCAGGCFLLLVRSYDADRRCEINLRNTELAIAMYALVKEKNELLFSSLFLPEFLPNLRENLFGILAKNIQ